jgi:hypothetical protein
MQTTPASTPSIPTSTPVKLGWGPASYIAGGDMYYAGYLDEIKIQDCVDAVTVFNTDDSGTDSLRQAMADVCDGGLVTFDSSLAGQTISLSSELTINKNITIDGSAASGVAISGNNSVRVFTVNSGVTAELKSLTVQDGNVSGNGGGIYNDGTLTITSSKIQSNTASGNGGGIYNSTTGTLNIIRSAVNNNTSNNVGGGVYSDKTVSVTDSTFSNNTVSGGSGSSGGIANGGLGDLTVVNSTFYNNTASIRYGGIGNDGFLTVINSTLSDNSAPVDGAGIGNSASGTITLLVNTLIANSTGADCVNMGAMVIENNNLIESTGADACNLTDNVNGDIIGSDPSLDTFTTNSDYPTGVYPLNPGSPAINAGDNATCNAVPVNNKDQGGWDRSPNGGATCDIGAYEMWDTDEPDTSIDSTDPATSPTSTTSMDFTFSGSEPVSPTNENSGVKSYECQLDSEGYSACTSPWNYSSLADGSHTIYVRAIDYVGNVDSSPAFYTWTISTPTPLDTVIDSGPSGTISSTSATFTYHATGDNIANGYFDCMLEPVESDWSICDGGSVTYTGLANGSYIFNVRAWDDAFSQVDLSPAEQAFTVSTDATPPDTTIVTKPVNPTAITNATFAFSGSDNVTAPANLTYMCALDGAPYSNCSVAVLFTNLSIGFHYLDVYTVDEAGNEDPTPAHYGWLIVKERVKNGGLNTYVGASKVPQYWAKNAAWSATDGKDTTSKKDGVASVKLVGQAGKTKTLTQTIAVSGAQGDQVRFSYWSKGASLPAAGACKVDVLVYNGSALKQTKTITCKTGTYGFTKQQLNFNATSAFTKIVVKFTFAKSKGSLWLDIVSLLK